MSLGPSQRSHLNRSLVINECTSELIKSVQMQNAASVAITAGEGLGYAACKACKCFL